MIVRIAVWIMLAGGVAGAWLTAHDHPWATRSVTWVQDFIVGNDDPSYTNDKLEVDLVDRINYARMPARLPLIKVDSEMDIWLKSISSTIDSDDLNALRDQISSHFPRYDEVMVNSNRCSQLRDLAGFFQDLSYQTQPQVNTVSVLVRKLSARRGYEALLVSGRRLDDFTPEALSERKTDTFFSECPHCHHPHACKVGSAQRGVILECPRCRKAFAVLAADSAGRFRYVNEFLTGYAPPCYFAEVNDKLQELYTIWNAVVSECLYKLDGTELNPSRDTWQTALETLTLGHGDCEDSSLLLADWLMSRGIQVRVALGRYGDLGQHAWCVAKIDNVDYLLESTEGPPNPSKPPYISELGARYVPETLFDKDAIYVRARPSARFEGDYWSPKNWIRVQPRHMFDTIATSDTKHAFGKRAAAAPAPQNFAPASRAVEETESLAPLGRLAKLRDLPAGTTFWTAPLPMPDATKH